ncbi:MAG: hypothetical protein OES57_06750 [Acidimicrobiia bacterium]|nr:hypothetical protein [Acidimicrobiia bacterium]
MSASNPDWSEMWVWRASARRAESARMAILTADHLFVTGPLDRRRIANLHEAAHLGSDHIRSVLESSGSADETVVIEREAITAVRWHRTIRTIDIEREGGEPVHLHSTESESTEEIGRGLQRALAPKRLPTSSPVERRKVVAFELLQGRGRLSLLVLGVSLVVMIVGFALGLFWLGVVALAVAAVALVGVASVVRDADHSVPYYGIELENDAADADGG